MRHVHSRHCRATVLRIIAGEHVSTTGKVKFFNETKGWIVEGAVKWTVGAVISHFQ
jgi:hypothetical protein